MVLFPASVRFKYTEQLPQAGTRVSQGQALANPRGRVKKKKKRMKKKRKKKTTPLQTKNILKHRND